MTTTSGAQFSEFSVPGLSKEEDHQLLVREDLGPRWGRCDAQRGLDGMMGCCKDGGRQRWQHMATGTPGEPNGFADCNHQTATPGWFAGRVLIFQKGGLSISSWCWSLVASTRKNLDILLVIQGDTRQTTEVLFFSATFPDDVRHFGHGLIPNSKGIKAGLQWIGSSHCDVLFYDECGSYVGFTLQNPSSHAMSFIRFIPKYSHIPRVNTPVSVMAVPSASAAGVQKGPHCIQRLVTRPPAHLASLETTSFWSPWKVRHFGAAKMVHLMGEPWSSSLEYLLDNHRLRPVEGWVKSRWLRSLQIFSVHFQPGQNDSFRATHELSSPS